VTEAGSNAPKAARITAKPVISPVAAVPVKPVVVAKAKRKPVAKRAVAKSKPAVTKPVLIKRAAPAPAAAKPPIAAKVEAPAPIIAKVELPVTAKVEAPVAAKAAPASKPKIETVASPAVQEKSVSDISSAPPLAAALQEGSKTMATKVETGADKVQAVLGDAQARIKTAWDKQSKLGEELVELAKGNVEAVVASARVAAKHGEELGQEAADYSKKSFENAIALFRSFASVKSPTELFQLQSDFAKSSFDSAVAESSKVSEKLLKIAGEVTQPISNRYAVAAEKLKTNF
jgi:phasin family protein